MNKEQLQQELKAKVKPGVKPSDLKKQNQEITQLPTPPDSPVLKPEPIILLDKQSLYLNKSDVFEKQKKNNQVLLEKIAKLEQQILDRAKTISDLDYLLKTGKNSEIIKGLQDKITEQEKIIAALKNNSLNQENIKTNQTFFCNGCQSIKPGTYTKKKVDSPFELRTHKKVCYLCSTCSPYYKELNEPNFDKDNNPYRIN